MIERGGCIDNRPVVTRTGDRCAMSLGARIKQLRIRKNKSLQDVADAVKASKAHIWEIEHDRSRNPSMDLLNGLANYFEVSVSYLVGENPDEEEAELVAMYRDLKKLTPPERERMRAIMKAAFPGKKREV
jgi:transcriptional regulator with XRE-family HTH domain